MAKPNVGLCSTDSCKYWSRPWEVFLISSLNSAKQLAHTESRTYLFSPSEEVCLAVFSCSCE